MMRPTGCYCRALLLQAALREETQRLADPIMRLPQAVATALPLTDVAAALQGGSAPPALLGADAQEDLRSIVRAELQGMAARIVDAQVQPLCAFAASGGVSSRTRLQGCWLRRWVVFEAAQHVVLSAS